ncbi:unnamed protein product, partial [Laminaria digitata]
MCAVHPQTNPNGLELFSPDEASSISYLNIRVTGKANINDSLRILVSGQEVELRLAPREREAFDIEVRLSLGSNTITIIASRDEGETRVDRTIQVTANPIGVGERAVNADGQVELKEGDTLSGKAAPGATIVARIDGRIICEATANNNGDWSCVVRDLGSSGLLEISDNDGNILGQLQADVIQGAPEEAKKPARGGCRFTATSSDANPSNHVLLLLLLGVI